MQTQIQVRVNEEGALRNQRFAFSDRYTLITELLQNARRAGADRIEVAFDAATQVLRVTDNGRGIEDFQKLLVFNESGWDDATCQHEHPFGIGFSKCLYAATRCIVRSGDRFVDFQTDDALARKPIDVHLDTRGPITGTLVELHGVDLPDMDARIGPLCAGFPVEVIYKGQTLDRHYAEGGMDFTRSAIGALHLAGVVSGNHSTTTLAFLQGFRVLSSRHYSPGHVNVVHLDPEKFMARLPDRDKLIDESEQERVIYDEIRAQWRVILEVAKYQLPARQFVDRYYGAMRTFDHLDLLNDLDVLPRGVCASIRYYPYQDTDSDDRFLDTRIDPPDRKAIESGATVIVDLDGLDEDNAAHWMFARAKGYLIAFPYGLAEGHWLHGKVRALATEMLGLEPIGTPLHANFEGCWINIKVVLCDAVRLRIGNEAVDITEEGLHHGGTLFIPAGEISGQPIRQVSTYVDENDQFREYELDTDREALADLIRRLRSIDPKNTLESLLRPLKLEKYPVLHGKTFRLHVVERAAHSIELIE